MSLIVVLSVVLITLVGAFVSILGNLVSSFLEAPAARHPRTVTASFAVGLVALMVATLLVQALNTTPLPGPAPTEISDIATLAPDLLPLTEEPTFTPTLEPTLEPTQEFDPFPTETPPAMEEPLPLTETPVPPPTDTPVFIVVTATLAPASAPQPVATKPPPQPSGDVWRGGTSQDLPIELRIAGDQVMLTAFDYRDLPYIVGQTCTGPKDGRFAGSVADTIRDQRFGLHTRDQIDGQDRDIVLNGRFLPDGLIGGSLHIILEIPGCRHDMALQWWAKKQ